MPNAARGLSWSQKEQIAAMERYKRDLTKQEAQDKGHDKLTKHCDEIRIQRETRQIVAHLRSRPSGISLRSKFPPYPRPSPGPPDR